MNLISEEILFSPLLADLRYPPGFSLSAYCCQNTFVLRDLSRLYLLLRFFFMPRALTSSSLPQTLWLARGSRTRLNRWLLLCL
jgi:hypothetical protein